MQKKIPKRFKAWGFTISTNGSQAAGLLTLPPFQRPSHPALSFIVSLNGLLLTRDSKQTKVKKTILQNWVPDSDSQGWKGSLFLLGKGGITATGSYRLFTGFPIMPTRPLQNAPFCPISVSGSNFNPQNTKCIPVVKIFAFLELEQNWAFFKGLAYEGAPQGFKIDF